MTNNLAYVMNELSINNLFESSSFFVTHFSLFQFKYEKTLQDNFKTLTNRIIEIIDIRTRCIIALSTTNDISLQSDDRYVLCKYSKICMKQKQRSWRINNDFVKM